MQHKFRRSIPAMLMLFLLAGCATTPSVPAEVVAQRAQARFDALIAKDYRAAYGFFTPTFREAYPYEQYIQARPPRARFLSAKVVGVDCVSDSACDVQMENTYTSPRGVKAAPGGEITRVTPERWVKVDGQWWLFQNR